MKIDNFLQKVRRKIAAKNSNDFKSWGQSKYNESNVLLLSSFQCFTVSFSYQNDNSSLLSERFQYFTGMLILVKCWNRSAGKLQLSVCYLSKLSVVNSCYSQHTAEMNNKMITAVYLQKYSSSISLE